MQIQLPSKKESIRLAVTFTVTVALVVSLGLVDIFVLYGLAKMAYAGMFDTITYQILSYFTIGASMGLIIFNALWRARVRRCPHCKEIL